MAFASTGQSRSCNSWRRQSCQTPCWNLSTTYTSLTATCILLAFAKEATRKNVEEIHFYWRKMWSSQLYRNLSSTIWTTKTHTGVKHRMWWIVNCGKTNGMKRSSQLYRNLSSCEISPKKDFRASHLHSICISAVYNSPHSMFHSFHGLMNSINWPACHCMGLHSSDGRALQRERIGHGFVEDPKSFFRANFAVA